MPDKIRYAYTKAKNTLNEVRFTNTGCMCKRCQDTRQSEIFEDVCKIVYPKLPFIPNNTNHHLRSIHYQKILEYLYNLRRTNIDIRRITHKSEKKSLIYCRGCGNLHLESNTKIIKDNNYCIECTLSNFECDMCHDFVNTRERLQVYDDDNNIIKICSSCFNLNIYKRCKCCGINSKKESMITYPMNIGEDGNLRTYTICETCSIASQIRCDICGELTIRQLIYDQNNKMICRACQEEEQGLCVYYFKPLRLHFKHDINEGNVSNRAFHMGFELEIAKYQSFMSGDALCHVLKERVGKQHIYTVQDGTIQRATDCEGVEVCSHPFTWQEYKKHGVYRWDDMLFFLRENGWKANLQGVGFHVHTTKAAWGDCQIYKLLQFIYKNPEFVWLIAERKPTDYCIMNERDFNEAVLVAKDKKNRKPDHYSIINLNNGRGEASKTIEFRMFQGTLEPLKFHKNIEFVNACYEFTLTQTHMTENNFKQFVNQNRKKYICLYEFMKGI